MVAEHAAVSMLAKGLVKPLSDIYDYVKAKAGLELKKLRNESTLRKMARGVAKISKVKTLWSDNKEVLLSSFYYPSRLSLEGGNGAMVDSLADLPPGHNYVIEGTVGQGKSIFMRYLATQELARTDDCRIPIFAEFRFLQPDETLEQFLLRAFQLVGFNIDGALLELYLDSGRVVLFFDAFDELDPDIVTRIIREIDQLTARGPAVQVIVSARPDTAIQRAPTFRVAKLCPLAPNDHKPFIERFVGKASLAAPILNAIKHSNAGVSELLTTPLMVTLLVMLYASRQHIPNSVSEFYGELFDVLFYKHDRTKYGFVRRRYVDLGDQKIKAIFEGVAFYSAIKGYQRFTPEQFAECAQHAAEKASVNVEGEKLRTEFVKTACLLKEEGNELSFVHKSVQEYYSAAFVAHSGDAFAERFYRTLYNAEPIKIVRWRQQLNFLSEIDEWRYGRFYFIRLLQELAVAFGVTDEEFFSDEFVIDAGGLDLARKGGTIDYFLSDQMKRPSFWKKCLSFSFPKVSMKSPNSGFAILMCPVFYPDPSDFNLSAVVLESFGQRIEKALLSAPKDAATVEVEGLIFSIKSRRSNSVHAATNVSELCRVLNVKENLDSLNTMRAETKAEWMRYKKLIEAEQNKPSLLELL